MNSQTVFIKKWTQVYQKLSKTNKVYANNSFESLKKLVSQWVQKVLSLNNIFLTILNALFFYSLVLALNKL